MWSLSRCPTQLALLNLAGWHCCPQIELVVLVLQPRLQLCNSLLEEKRMTTNLNVFKTKCIIFFTWVFLTKLVWCNMLGNMCPLTHYLFLPVGKKQKFYFFLNAWEALLQQCWMSYQNLGMYKPMKQYAELDTICSAIAIFRKTSKEWNINLKRALSRLLA